MLRLRNVLPLFFAGIFTLGLLSCSDDSVAPVTTGAISGQVLDAGNSNPLAEASLTTSPATSAILADGQGEYRFENLEEGKYTISATKSGYKKGIVSVEVVAGETVTAILQLNREDAANTAPDAPAGPLPENGATAQPVSLTLKWTASDPDAGDTLSYDVYLFSGNESPALVAADSPADSLKLDNLSYGTIYFWQVIAKDDNSGVTNGSVWQFRTEAFPDNPLVYADNSAGNYNIFSAGYDTLDFHPVQLTEDQNREWWPRLSPSRDRIAFVSDKTVEPQIYTMNRDGSNVTRVTSIPVTGYHNYGMGFCWSPDGTQFLYGNYDNLYRIDANGTGLTRIAAAPAGRNFRETDWSPLGTKIAVLTMGSWFYDSEIYLMDADGGNASLLVSNLPGAVESPSFSPDGQSIIYTHDVSGYEVSSGRQLNSHIFIMKIDGSDTTDVSVNKPAGTNDSNPRFSPDGSRIIFCNAPNNDAEAKSVWIMDLDGHNREKIISHGTMPDWR